MKPLLDRRAFVQDGSAAIAGAALSQLPAATIKGFTFDQASAAEPLVNWAGNLRYSAQNVVAAKTLDEVRDFVKRTRQLKALGSRHSFSSIADTTDTLLSMKDMNRVIALDAAKRTVTVEAGITYGQLCPVLHEQGFALHNLASLPHISIAGACATGTHGSGVRNGNLATAVVGLEVVTADGSVLNFTPEKDPGEFFGAVVNLGALGVVTKVTLRTEASYVACQDVYLDLPTANLERDFHKIMAAGYSVSLFTDWQNRRINEVWIKRRATPGASVAAEAEFYGARLAKKNVHPILDLSAESCTEQMGLVGPWFERLPHFRMGFTPSSGKELQSEYFVPLGRAVEAILAVERLRDQVSPHLLISELRTIAADQLWMSPCYKQDSLAIHFTWKPDWDSVRRVLPVIEKELASFQVRPHWGKLFTIPSAQLQSRYPMLADFKRLAARLDPQARFRNEFLESTLSAPHAP